MLSKFQGQLKHVNFHDPKFCTGDIDKKITKAIKDACKDLKVPDQPDEDALEAMTSYIKKTCCKYAVYKIIDGNQKPLQQDPYCDRIVMQTRSINETLNMLSQFIEVPAEDENKVEKKEAEEKEAFERTKEWLKESGFILTIYCDKEYPKDPFVAVKKNGFWFYIKDTDFFSKNILSATQGIFSMSETGAATGTPILTLPLQ